MNTKPETKIELTRVVVGQDEIAIPIAFLLRVTDEFKAAYSGRMLEGQQFKAKYVHNTSTYGRPAPDWVELTLIANYTADGWVITYKGKIAF